MPEMGDIDGERRDNRIAGPIRLTSWPFMRCINRIASKVGVKFLKFMVKCSIVMLVLSSHGATQPMRKFGGRDSGGRVCHSRHNGRRIGRASAPP